MSSHNSKVKGLQALIDRDRLAAFVCVALDTDMDTARTAVSRAAWNYMGSITSWVLDIEDRKPKKRKKSR